MFLSNPQDNWYTTNLSSTLSFNSGDTFYVYCFRPNSSEIWYTVINNAPRSVEEFFEVESKHCPNNNFKSSNNTYSVAIKLVINE